MEHDSPADIFRVSDDKQHHQTIRLEVGIRLSPFLMRFSAVNFESMNPSAHQVSSNETYNIGEARLVHTVA